MSGDAGPMGGNRATRSGASFEVPRMRRYPMRRALAISPLIALVAQLLLAAATVAGTGGGNFPSG